MSVPEEDLLKILLSRGNVGLDGCNDWSRCFGEWKKYHGTLFIMMTALLEFGIFMGGHC